MRTAILLVRLCVACHATGEAVCLAFHARSEAVYEACHATSKAVCEATCVCVCVWSCAKQGIHCLCHTAVISSSYLLSFLLQLYATEVDGSNRLPCASHAGVVIKVKDVNDNPPFFSRPSYVVSVMENAAVDTPLIAISVCRGILVVF